MKNQKNIRSGGKKVENFACIICTMGREACFDESPHLPQDDENSLSSTLADKFTPAEEKDQHLHICILQISDRARVCFRSDRIESRIVTSWMWNVKARLMKRRPISLDGSVNVMRLASSHRPNTHIALTIAPRIGLRSAHNECLITSIMQKTRLPTIHLWSRSLRMVSEAINIPFETIYVLSFSPGRARYVICVREFFAAPMMHDVGVKLWWAHLTMFCAHDSSRVDDSTPYHSFIS